MKTLQSIIKSIKINAVINTQYTKSIKMFRERNITIHYLCQYYNIYLNAVVLNHCVLSIQDIYPNFLEFSNSASNTHCTRAFFESLEKYSTWLFFGSVVILCSYIFGIDTTN